MADREITVKVKVCPLDHGGPNNAAEVYGHHGSTRICVRIGSTQTWIFDPKRIRTEKGA